MSLAQAFTRGNGRRIKWQGATVHSVARFDVEPGDRIMIHRLASSRRRAQALCLAVDRGDLSANGMMIPTVAVWSHTAPERAEVQVVGRRARSIDVWNAWSYEGVVSSWLGNAGMVVEEDDDGRLLRCSDGLGAASFDDLVLRLEVMRGG